MFVIENMIIKNNIFIVQKNKIAHENDILVDKMLYIEKGKTSLNKEILFQTYRKINFYNVNNKRIKGLQRINTENKVE